MAELCQIVTESDLVFTDNFVMLYGRTRSAAEATWSELAWQNAVDDMPDEFRRSRHLLEAAMQKRNPATAKNQAETTAFIQRKKLTRLVDVQPNNQTVTVEVGVSLDDIRAELRKVRQDIPLQFGGQFMAPLCRSAHRLFELIENDPPHTLSAQHGGWRDWILEAKVVLPSGELVKSGAPVVKSVTGYDLHKLIVGGRATLGLVAEVTIRTTPLAAITQPDLETADRPTRMNAKNHYIQVLKSEWNDLVEWVRVHSDRFTLDHAARQAMFTIREESDTHPFKNGIWWVHDQEVVDAYDPATILLMRRAKQIFDPTNKLNPGEFGFL